MYAIATGTFFCLWRTESDRKKMNLKTSDGLMRSENEFFFVEMKSKHRKKRSTYLFCWRKSNQWMNVDAEWGEHTHTSHRTILTISKDKGYTFARFRKCFENGWKIFLEIYIRTGTWTWPGFQCAEFLNLWKFDPAKPREKKTFEPA